MKEATARHSAGEHSIEFPQQLYQKLMVLLPPLEDLTPKSLEQQLRRRQKCAKLLSGFVMWKQGDRRTSTHTGLSHWGELRLHVDKEIRR